MRLVSRGCEAAVERACVLCSGEAVTDERVNALDLAIQIERADVLLQKFDHFLFNALIETGEWRHQIDVMRMLVADVGPRSVMCLAIQAIPPT
jgi:hypothetical protein